MNWFAWRQYRKQFLILGIALAIFAAVTIPTGMRMWHTYQHALATCGQTKTCDQLSTELFNSSNYSSAFHLMQFLILALPVLLGLFWGAPLIAKEYADGTNKLVWTQGISRRRWLTVKLVWILVATAIFTGAFAALATFWWRAGDALTLGRFQPLNFATQGFVPAAYAVFAVAVGITLGTLFRRTLLALGITLGLLIAVFVAIPQVVRSHYQTPYTYKTSIASALNGKGNPLSPSGPEHAGAIWSTRAILTKSDGTPFNWSNPPHDCIRTTDDPTSAAAGEHKQIAKDSGHGDAIIAVNGSDHVSLYCLGTHGYSWTIKYQPAYRYWNFQRIETALFLGLSVLPIAATYWLVLRRDA